jgi:hypothetical protein
MVFRKHRKAGRRSFFKSRSRHSSAGVSPIKLALGAAVYGLVRNKISALAAPLTSKLPLGNYSDEVVLGIAGWIAAKKGSGLIKQAGTAALTIEAYRVGELASAGIFPTGNSANGAVVWR